MRRIEAHAISKIKKQWGKYEKDEAINAINNADAHTDISTIAN